MTEWRYKWCLLGRSDWSLECLCIRRFNPPVFQTASQSRIRWRLFGWKTVPHASRVSLSPRVLMASRMTAPPSGRSENSRFQSGFTATVTLHADLQFCFLTGVYRLTFASSRDLSDWFVLSEGSCDFHKWRTSLFAASHSWKCRSGLADLSDTPRCCGAVLGLWVCSRAPQCCFIFFFTTRFILSSEGIEPTAFLATGHLCQSAYILQCLFKRCKISKIRSTNCFVCLVLP